MDPVRSDVSVDAQLKELKAELKELRAAKEKSLPGAKVTKGPPSEILPFLAEVVKKQRAALREAYSNREPLILRLNSRQDPCASPPGQEQWVVKWISGRCMETVSSKYLTD
ncbi:60S ribosomal protein L35-3-like isoform X3 [Triticum dicoccoides]|uniref:60S ribosomal protein L35-3-like isoform X3 n=1 Tax=Triticum dicoccoides TaxID=85692 RepID=UPI00188F8A4B|nr:60S ribosomal protein L35-3-like isoform X3 [Triticum dicoccoides]